MKRRKEKEQETSYYMLHFPYTNPYLYNTQAMEKTNAVITQFGNTRNI